MTKINSPKYSKVAREKAARSRPANNPSIIAIFDNVDVEQYYCEIDGIRYLRSSFLVASAKNIHLNQNRNPKDFYKVYVGEHLFYTHL